MRLLDITAVAHRDGHRIDIAWSYPPAAEVSAGVAVVRGRHDYPATPDDGVLVGEGIGITTASDTSIQAERTYYYALFPFTGNPPVFHTRSPDDARRNRATAMATAPYGFADLLHSLLPAVYHRYDAERSQLRRFLELPGGELDRFYSHARAALGLVDPLWVDGRLLPLLAHWIGWHTDHRLPLAAQRNEVRSAPHLYQATGGARALDATVSRVTGWTNRTKEFVHNVARTNEPECQTLWGALRDSQGQWSEPALASVHFVHDGRSAMVPGPGNSAQLFYHTRRAHGWDIWAKRLANGVWQPSAPVVSRPGVDKHPTAAMQGDTLRLYWQGRAPGERIWRVWHAAQTGEKWSEPALLGEGGSDQRTPAAVADDDGGLWLFWLEQEAGTWLLKYNRRDATDWQLSTPAVLPTDGEHGARLTDDLFVLFHPGATVPKLWVFWARQEPAGPNQTRWHIVYRCKQGLDPTARDWSPIRRLTRQAHGDHDRQPAARAAGDDAVELFWSSTRLGGWAIFRNVLDAESDPPTWGTPQRLFAGAHAMRAPLALDTYAGTFLLHRSNQSLEHGRTASGATTLDHRYAGTTTMDIRARDRLALRGTFEDPQRYLYDTARETGRGRIARESVGLYLTPRTETPEEIQAAVSRLAGVLEEFMPVSARPVFITE
ncbi:hypothetical protein OHB05_00940 [Streptomyces sp. NBC_00638]|uniref:hypothetical protein n=1 Tax=unclassified Streptomyces TaxID=2593676 RepID=UPI00224F20B8|nr:hypothetical protein [Streptomyces sp. NBC_00638]MCX5001195.1 hypothetical protein [Streptomyces sp. NBC_00638]